MKEYEFIIAGIFIVWKVLLYVVISCHWIKNMSVNMLAEQNVIMESTDIGDTVPLIGFITTDDGHTLLAVAGKTIKL